MPEHTFPTKKELYDLSRFLDGYAPASAREIFLKVLYQIETLEALNRGHALSVLRKANEGPFEAQYAHEV